MKDRISTYPGRVTLTPVEGQTNTYDMQRADDPIQEGTPLNTANLLTDETATALGLDPADNPSVNDALGAVGETAGNALPKTGGTMTGNLILNADPTADLGAATKQYVDNKVASTGTYHTEIITASGDWQVPGGVTSVFVRIFGGGGCGSGSGSTGYYGGGGGGGHMATSTISVAPGTMIPITIGAGGVESNSASARTGGTSSFGVYLSADGGSGGTWNTTPYGGSGGSGGGGGGYYYSSNDTKSQ